MREIIWCPICGKQIFSHESSPIVSRATTSSRAPRVSSVALLNAMMMDAEQAHQEKIARAEAACVEHFQTRHALRLRLWKRLRWTWLMNRRFPWNPEPDSEDFRFPA